jgi:cytochrome c heme-lyase
VQAQPSHPKAAQCPIQRDKDSFQKSGQCPVEHGELNPLNQMPSLANAPQPGQSVDLPTERTESSIPRDGRERWEYPSPQQFYNALVRKGWETPEEHVEVMVEIHNFLNEQAWLEVLKWEKRQHGQVVCLNLSRSRSSPPLLFSSNDIQLARLRGRPGELSPKARLFMLAGWLLPSRFGQVLAYLFQSSLVTQALSFHF